MAGTIALSEGIRWSVKSSIFYWTVELLADEVTHPETERELREIPAGDLGWLGVDDYPEGVREEILTTIRTRLLRAAEHRLPDTPQRGEVLVLLGRLAELAEAVHTGRRPPADGEWEPVTPAERARAAEAVARFEQELDRTPDQARPTDPDLNPFLGPIGLDPDGTRQPPLTPEEIAHYEAARHGQLPGVADDEDEATGRG